MIPNLVILGVMQNYYEQHHFSAKVVQLSFVGTIANLLLNSLGPLTQSMLMLMSSRTVLWISVILSVVGLELASFSTEVRRCKITTTLKGIC